jgi:hypothetical protein
LHHPHAPHFQPLLAQTKILEQLRPASASAAEGEAALVGLALLRPGIALLAAMYGRGAGTLLSLSVLDARDPADLRHVPLM